jgi:hypothetical protein
MQSASMLDPIYADVERAMAIAPWGFDWLLSHYISNGQWDLVLEATNLAWTDEDLKRLEAALLRNNVQQDISRNVFEFNHLHVTSLVDNWALGHFRDHTLGQLAMWHGARGANVATRMLDLILSQPRRYCHRRDARDGENLGFALRTNGGVDMMSAVKSKGISLLQFVTLCTVQGPSALIDKQAANMVRKSFASFRERRLSLVGGHGLEDAPVEVVDAAESALVSWWARDEGLL